MSSTPPPQDAPPPSDTPPPSKTPPPSDSSPWNWLLLVPIVIPLLTPLYNHKTPDLFGFPFFYWLQLAFVLLGVGCTSIVYNRTKRRG